MLKDHNAVTPVRLEPAALRSRVKHSNVVSLSKNINPSLVMVQPKKTRRPFITERLLMERKKSNQTNNVKLCYNQNILART